jgi:hypothetical protein
MESKYRKLELYPLFILYYLLYCLSEQVLYFGVLKILLLQAYNIHGQEILREDQLSYCKDTLWKLLKLSISILGKDFHSEDAIVTKVHQPMGLLHGGVVALAERV